MAGVLLPPTDTKTILNPPEPWRGGLQFPCELGTLVYLEGDSSIDLSRVQYLPILSDGGTFAVIHGLILYPGSGGQLGGYIRVGQFQFTKKTCVRLGMTNYPPSTENWPSPGFEESTFKIY